jgi:hypothetical protein
MSNAAKGAQGEAEKIHGVVEGIKGQRHRIRQLENMYKQLLSSE